MKPQFVLKALAGAVALAAAGNVAAVDLNTVPFNEASTKQVTIRLSGATAHDAGLLLLLRNTTSGAQICKPNTLDVYQTASKNNTLYYCEGGLNSGFASGNTLASKRYIAILKESDGGSGVGVAPIVRPGPTYNVVDNTTVTRDWIDPTNATVSGTAGSPVAVSGAFSAYTQHLNIVDTVTTTTGNADAGISDVEPARFAAIYNPALTAAELNALTINGISGVIFATPVTKAVYERLQAVQFPVNNVCNPNNASYDGLATTTTVASSEACMPSLSRDLIGAIFTGQITKWSQIKSAHTPGVNVNTVTISYAGKEAAALASDDIFIQRRVATSGTQRSNEVYFSSAGCIAGAPAFLSKTDLRVTENSGTSNVVSGLNADNTADKGSIGTLTAERPPNNTAGYRNIKINGSSASLLNVVKGSYDFFFESTIQWRRIAVGGMPAITLVKRNVLTSIVNQLGKPDVVATLDKGFVDVYGRTGLIGNAVANKTSIATTPYKADGSNPADTDDVYNRPVATSTRGLTGSPNACRVPVKVNADVQVGS